MNPFSATADLADRDHVLAVTRALDPTLSVWDAVERVAMESFDRKWSAALARIVGRS